MKRARGSASRAKLRSVPYISKSVIYRGRGWGGRAVPMAEAMRAPSEGYFIILTVIRVPFTISFIYRMTHDLTFI